MSPAAFDFERDVLEASRHKPVLVDFWAEWCGPCRVLGPVLDRLAQRSGGAFTLVKVNTDENPEVAQTYRISSIPAVKLFSQGKVVGEFVGALPEREVARFLEQHLPSPGKEAVSAARAALKAGKRAEAQRLLERGHAEEPDNAAVRVELAALLFTSERTRASELLAGVPPLAEEAERGDAIKMLLELMTRADRETPQDADWGRYFDGAKALGRGDAAAAFDTWLGLVRAHQKLDEDGPRRAIVALFAALGDEDEGVRDFRRAFASALY